MNAELINSLRHPLAFMKLCWPEVIVYRKQVEVMESVVLNDQTWVVAGNQLGKDFIGGFLCLWFFLAFREVRVITTSVKDDHLRVLWGEIGRFLQTATLPDDRSKQGILSVDKEGPLLVNHRDIRKVRGGQRCEISYLRGMVSEKGEGLAGHHAQATFAVLDECSGIEPIVFKQVSTWAKRLLCIGNANECAPTHPFRKAVKEGDIVATR